MVAFEKVEAAKALLADPDCMKTDNILTAFRDVADSCVGAMTAIEYFYTPATDTWIKWVMTMLPEQERTFLKNTYNTMKGLVGTING